jgi:hypothetical protein
MVDNVLTFAVLGNMIFFSFEVSNVADSSDGTDLMIFWIDK